jgi:diguanylate cyclase (GGDEF)-like protein
MASDEADDAGRDASAPPNPETGPIRVLLVGGSSADGDLLRALLEHTSQSAMALSHAPNLSQAFETLESNTVDVLLMDVGTGQPRELVAVSQARVRAPLVPVVVIADSDDEDIALKAVEIGARGYLIKCALSAGALVWSLQHAIRNQRMFVELNIARERARQLATYDQLTGFANRSLFQDRLDQAVASARRNRQKLGVLFLDLDRFKVVNDTLGHLAGDALLRLASQRIATCLRKSDTGARLGGDEFAILVTNLAEEGDTVRVAEKILTTLREPVPLKGKDHLITASIGIATFPKDAASADELLKKADAAMYAAKSSGRARYALCSQLVRPEEQERAARERRLRAGLEGSELALHYQPVVDVARGRVVGAEALIRWRHPDLGLMLPGDFLGIAEESDLIIEIGAWVLKTACAQAAEWQRAGHPGFRIAVNVAPQQFGAGEFVGSVRDALRETQLRPESLELEITERSLLSGGQRTLAQFAMLRGLGVRTAIDDFGTGYSALAYLKQLPVDVLKIDQSFTRAVATDPADATITSTIVQMARALNLTTIAEGIETTEQMQLLASYGCSRMQGYLFGEPVTAGEFAKLLSARPFFWVSRRNEGAGA